MAGEEVLAGGAIAGLIALFAAFAFIFVIIFVGLYIYMALAYKAIAKKAKLSNPNLSWIPLVGPLIIAFQASKMHWWPWLLLIGYVIPVVNVVAQIAFAVFVIIWHWKMFERIKRPGWWAVLFIIPIVGLIMVGIAAWSKD